MLIVGVDLAAEPKNTAACMLEWTDRPVVIEVIVGRTLGNDRLVALIDRAERAGIDAPFGWPVNFVAAITEWQAGRPWPGGWTAEDRRAWRLRLTDVAVRERGGPTPLSVSADSIGVCAMRAATILSQVVGAPVDRVDGPIYEVYPAATLAALGIARRGYKADRARREAILDMLVERFGLATGEWREPLVATDHGLDALLSAISARAAAAGASEPLRDEDPAVVAQEGWIHVPRPDWCG